MFRNAAVAAQQVVAATTASESTRAEAKCVAGLALAHMEPARDSRRMCDEGRSALQALKDAAAIAQANLLLAEILLASGTPREADNLIREALVGIDAAGNKEMGWRAWALAARASRQTGDPKRAAEAARNASSRLAELRSSWGTAIDRYLQRPDVRMLEKELK